MRCRAPSPRPTCTWPPPTTWAHRLRQCLVIEDTPTGVTAGVAAGATVWAYCPQPEHGPSLREAGASRLFGHMGDLPGLLAAA
jgi:beta-phosphoglucomutase-like phosphatase (HAD superfamily)